MMQMVYASERRQPSEEYFRELLSQMQEAREFEQAIESEMRYARRSLSHAAI